MTQKRLPISVYAEATPNPHTMKFVASVHLVDEDVNIEYKDPDDTTDSPLAQRIFNFPFVTGIFISQNFVTITKNDLCDWSDVTLELREYIQNFLQEGNKPFSKPIAEMEIKSLDDNFKPTTPTTDIEKKIVEVLDEYIQPAVARDGGAINFKSFENGKLTVVMRGACSGCPSSTVTLKNGVETLMKQMVPEVTEVFSEEL